MKTRLNLRYTLEKFLYIGQCCAFGKLIDENLLKHLEQKLAAPFAQLERGLKMVYDSVLYWLGIAWSFLYPLGLYI